MNGRSCRFSCAMQGITDFTVTITWIEVMARSRLAWHARQRFQHALHHLAERRAAYSPFRLFGIQLGWWKAPDLLRVREIEVAANRPAQSTLENRRKARFRIILPQKGFADSVHHHPGNKPWGDVCYQIEWLEWEVDPPAAKADAAVSRPRDQVVPQQRANVRHDGRWAHGMQAMTAEIHGNPVDNEAARVSAHLATALEHGHGLPSALRKFVGRRQPRRSAPEHHERRSVWVRHPEIQADGDEGAAADRGHSWVTIRPARPVTMRMACQRMPDASTASSGAP